MNQMKQATFETQVYKKKNPHVYYRVAWTSMKGTFIFLRTKSKEREEEKGLIEKKESDQEKESGRSKESRMKRQKEGEEAENKKYSF